MQSERAELYFQQGGSDKVYHPQLETVQDKWSVNAQWGRRGSSLRSDVKVNDATYEEAKSVYDRILREKIGKGYQIAEGAANSGSGISVGMPTKERSGHVPELLTSIEEEEARALVPNLLWWFQQKFDGRRLRVADLTGFRFRCCM